MSPRLLYRRLKGYKYILTEVGYPEPMLPSHMVNIYPMEDIAEPLFRPFVRLSKTGQLDISGYYAWDGPSGPTFDTSNFMRGSLVHDALYQLMRAGRIGLEIREKADRELVRICREDGMSSLRAWYVLKGVQWFGKSGATPQVEPQSQVFQAPR